MGSIGVWQVILILVIVLIIFGAGKLPKVMGDVAKGVKNFKSGLKDEDLAEDKKQIDGEPSGEPVGSTSTMASNQTKSDEPAKTN